MIKITKVFLDKEIRSGFNVSEEMKQVWAAEMELLAEVIAVCKKYNLSYYADYGTLLGAVRHKGFIPWDDDIDISLKRKDYNKLFKVLPNELPEEYGINSLALSNDMHQPWGSVFNSKTVCWDEERSKKFFGCPYVVGIDIYPLDYWARDKEFAEMQMNLYNVVYDCAQRFEELSESGDIDKYIPQIEEFCRIKFDSNIGLEGQLWRLSDEIASMVKESEADYLTLFARVVMGDNNFKLKKEWYDNTIEMPFEILQIDVPCGYHGVLTKEYGDYMIPCNGQSAHGYPIFKEQKEYFKRIGKIV